MQRLVPLILLIALAASAAAQPLEARLAWRQLSVVGAAHSTCLGDHLYVVGYEGSAQNATGRVEERAPEDGRLLGSLNLGSALYSCAYAGRLYVAGSSRGGRWLIAALGPGLSVEAVVEGVKGYATALAADSQYLYVAGVDESCACARVEKRRLGDLSLVGSYTSEVPNTYVFASALGNASLWLVGSALAPSGFAWRVEALSPGLTPLLRLRPQVPGFAYSAAASQGVVYVSGPNGTLALGPDGSVEARVPVGGKVAASGGVVAVLGAGEPSRVYVLNASTLALLRTVELGGAGLATFGSAAASGGTFFFAGAEKSGGTTAWAVYAVVLQAASEQPRGSQAGNRTATAPAEQKPTAQQPQPVQLVDVLFPVTVTGLTLVALAAALRRRRR